MPVSGQPYRDKLAPMGDRGDPEGVEGSRLPAPTAPGEPSIHSRAHARRRCRAAGVTLGVVLTGLALRGAGPEIGLPFGLTKYGGSTLWGAMVYGMEAALAPAVPPRRLAAAALAVAALVELSRLVHTPSLDAFRLTASGALLLGRVFSPWNIVAYAAGIASAWRWDSATTP